MTSELILGYVLIAVVFMGVLWMYLIGRFWFRALLSGVRISPTEILIMRFRGTPVKLIITELVKASKNNIVLSRSDLEICYLGGGDVTNVVNGLVYSKAHGLKLSFKEAVELDLKRHDIVSHLRNSPVLYQY